MTTLGHTQRSDRPARQSAHSRNGLPPPRATALLLSLTLGALASSALAQTSGNATAGSAAPASTEAATLAPIKVQGHAEEVGPYAGGQVTTGGRVGLLGDKDFMETPFNTISYTDKFIADRQARDITDVISATDPTVFSNGQTGTINEFYYIRGFASAIGDVSFGGLYGISPYYRVSPEMFERIDVLKGPSALLNGMPPGGSVGGSVNLVPKRAGDDPLARLTGTYMSDAQFGTHVDLGRRFGDNRQFGIRFNGVYRDGEGAINNQKHKSQLGSLGLDWRGERARVSADLYSSEDHVKGQTRGISLAPGIAVPKPPRPDTLLNPDWAFVETKDKGAVIRGEYDISDRLMAYAAFGASKTNYGQNGAISAQVLNPAGDFKTVMGQLAFDVEKRSGELGLKGKLDTGPVKHQWALNATHYSHTQNDYGRRSVPGADWTTNIYHPVWATRPPSSRRTFPRPLRLASYGLADTMSFAEDRVQLTLGVRRQQVISDTYNIKTGDRTSRYDESATTPAAAILVKLTDRVSVYANYIEGLPGRHRAHDGGQRRRRVRALQDQAEGNRPEAGPGRLRPHRQPVRDQAPQRLHRSVHQRLSFGGEQRNRGVEWSFFGAPWTGLRLMGGVAYVDPELTKTAGGVNQGKTATGVPKLQGKLGGMGRARVAGFHADRQRDRRDQAVHQRRQLAVGAGTRGL